MIEELKKEYWKHFNSYGVIDGNELNEDAGENIYCDCASEDDCQSIQLRLLKAIKEMEK